MAGAANQQQVQPASGGKGGGVAQPSSGFNVNQAAAGGGVAQPSGGFNVNQAAAGGLEQAMQGTMAGMQYQPMQVGAAAYAPAQIAGASPIRVQNVQAGQIAGTNLGAYTNPYESQVVGQALGDIERSRQMQQNQLGAQASAARAFGGSRQGIAEAETNRAFADQAAQTAAGLRQAGYQQAQALAGQDIASRMQAALANQGANLQAQSQTAGNVLAMQQANQGARNQAGQFGASAQNQAMIQNQQAGLQAAQQRLAAAQQLGGLGQQAFNTGQAISAQQMQQGLLQQQLQQQLINAAMGQYAGYTGAPQTALNLPLAALGQASMGQGTTTQTQNPSLFQMITPFLI